MIPISAVRSTTEMNRDVATPTNATTMTIATVKRDQRMIQRAAPSRKFKFVVDLPACQPGPRAGRRAAYLYSRQYEKAVEQFRKTLELDQAFITAHVFLGQAYEKMRLTAEAIVEFETAVELSQRHPAYLADLGHRYAVAGRREDALRIIDELIETSSRRYVAPRVVAEIHIGLGDLNQAFAWLDKALRQRNGWLIHFRDNPRYDPLRTDARYGGSRASHEFPVITPARMPLAPIRTSGSGTRPRPRTFH